VFALLIDGNVFRLQLELGENLFHGNALAAVLRERSLAVTDAPPVFFRHGLVIRRCVRDRGGRWIEHGFEETANGGNLTRREAVKEFVNLLFLVSQCGPKTGSASLSA
jgi:hypothetical protein